MKLAAFALISSNFSFSVIKELILPVEMSRSLNNLESCSILSATLELSSMNLMFDEVLIC